MQKKELFSLLNFVIFDDCWRDCFGVVALLRIIKQQGGYEQGLGLCNSFKIIYFHL